MRLYKYYRPDFYFEKSLRYDEIYFSSNEQLNDPHDLNIKPYFGDNKEAWREILKLNSPYDTWDLSKYIDINNGELLQDLNNEFKGQKVNDVAGVMSAINEKKSSLVQIFRKYLIPEQGTALEKPETASQNFVIYLGERIVRRWNRRYYSCSFSRDPLEPRMWAHYGGGFRGCVLIYKCLANASISLRPNIFAGRPQNFGFAEVDYQDKDKLVDILDLTSKINPIDVSLLNKNSFWSYEKEMRLLLGETFDSVRCSMVSEVPKSNRSRIFHHEWNAIEGVIFGANCSEVYKNKVTSIFAEKYSCLINVGRPAFFTFDSSLTSAGRVEISSGALCLVHELESSQVIKEIFEGKRLDLVLNERGIPRYSEV